METEYIPEVKASMTRHRGSPPVVAVILDRRETIHLISQLAASLEVYRVTRDSVEWNVPPVITMPITVNGKFFAEAKISVDLTKGYLNGDILKEEDKS